MVVSNKTKKSRQLRQFCGSSRMPRCHNLFHMGINSLSGGPSQVMVMRQFNILLDRRFRKSVLICERAEKPHSQSAVDIGMSRPIAASFVIFENIHIHSCQPSRNSLDCPGNGQCVPLSWEPGVLSRVFSFPQSPISAGHIPVFNRLSAAWIGWFSFRPRACRDRKVWSGKNGDAAVFVSSNNYCFT